MTTRSQPYRREMPLHIFPLIRVASRITLYLLNQSGPTSFTFKDRLGAKHKASLGNSIHCSCQIRVNDHCIHTIYILIRIFKIPFDNPLIWQNSFLDSELTDIVTGKYSAQTIMIPLLSEELTPSLEFMQPTKILSNVQVTVERMPLRDQSECPICQEPMDRSMCLTYCKVGCGNNFHLSCLKIWVEHKQSTEGKVTCPMCRCQYQEGMIQSIKEEQREYIKEQQKIKIRKMKFGCEGCGKKELVGEVYKCIYCQNYSLCIDCFLSKKHIKHPFIKFNGEDWQGTENRIQQNKKIKEFLEEKRKETYKAQQIIEKIQKMNFLPIKILDFVAASYPYVSQYICQHIDPYSKLEFNADDIVCFHCGNARMIFLRRLLCGHFIDHNCLKERIGMKKFHCDKCGAKFLKGYENLMQHQEKEMHEKGECQKAEERFLQPLLSRRTPSFDQYNFRVSEEEPQPEPDNQQTLHSIFGGGQTVHIPRNVTSRTNKRLEDNIRKNIVRENSVVPNSNNQIRVRNLSLNVRKPPKPLVTLDPQKKRKKPTAILNFAVEGQTFARNQNKLR